VGPGLDYARFLHAAAAALALVVVPIIALTDWLPFDRVAWARAFLCAGLLAAALVAELLARAGRVRAGAIVLVACVWSGATAFAFVSGIGLHSSAVYAYAPIILYTALMCGSQYASVLAVLTLAALGTLTWAENSGRIDGWRAFVEQTTNLNFAIGVAAALLFALLVALAYQRIVRQAVAALEDSRRDITEARDAVVAANRGLEQRIAERTRELADKVEELESFNDTVARDLLGPVRGILGDAKDATLPRRVGEAAERLDRLLVGLLELAQLGRRPVTRRTVDLSTLARHIADLLAAQHGGAVAFVIAPGLEAQADPDLVRVLLRNLMDNAVKFSRGRAGARVEFGAETLDPAGTLSYYVRDNGIGFDASLGRQLFRPFHRLHDLEGIEGLGIGLASARRIVTLHRGSISCASLPGRGATFYFTFGR
jgi:signal transduction histidine kinase